MTLREIDRQYQHWAVFPPPSIALSRIGQTLGLPAPTRRDVPAQAVTSHDELRAIAASMGVTSGG